MKTKDSILGMVPIEQRSRIELEAILYMQGIEYPENAKKEDLIKLIKDNK